MSKAIKLTVSRKDLIVEWSRGSGNGGQKKQKTSSKCRIYHPASGAEGIAEDNRSAEQNKKLALERLANSKKFTIWCKMQLGAMEEGYRNLESKVDSLMEEKNITTELGVDCQPGEDHCDKK